MPTLQEQTSQHSEYCRAFVYLRDQFNGSQVTLANDGSADVPEDLFREDLLEDRRLVEEDEGEEVCMHRRNLVPLPSGSNTKRCRLLVHHMHCWNLFFWGEIRRCVIIGLQLRQIQEKSFVQVSREDALKPTSTPFRALLKSTKSQASATCPTSNLM